MLTHDEIERSGIGMLQFYSWELGEEWDELLREPPCKETISMKPTVGRIVHFVPPEDAGWKGQHMAAIVTHVWSEKMINAAIFNPNGETFGKTSIEEDPEGKKPYSWHWPEREES